MLCGSEKKLRTVNYPSRVESPRRTSAVVAHSLLPEDAPLRCNGSLVKKNVSREACKFTRCRTPTWLPRRLFRGANLSVFPSPSHKQRHGKQRQGSTAQGLGCIEETGKRRCLRLAPWRDFEG